MLTPTQSWAPIMASAALPPSCKSLTPMSEHVLTLIKPYQMRVLGHLQAATHSVATAP